MIWLCLYKILAKLELNSKILCGKERLLNIFFKTLHKIQVHTEMQVDLFLNDLCSNFDTVVKKILLERASSVSSKLKPNMVSNKKSPTNSDWIRSLSDSYKLTIYFGSSV